MPIRIVDHAAKTVVCFNCQSKLEYMPDDIKESEYRAVFTGVKFFYIICPVCGSNAVISVGDNDATR